MNPLEEILAMAYDPRFNAPGIEDPRRRMNQQGQGGGGIAGPEATLGRLLPFLLGIQQQNIAGFNSQGVGGGMTQPAMNTAFPIGGQNIAPGNPQGQSINPGGPNPGGTVISDGRTIQTAAYPGFGDIGKFGQAGGSQANTGAKVFTPRSQTGGGGRTRQRMGG